MLLADKPLRRLATMARFRVTDANAAAFAALRRVLDGDLALLWLHGRTRAGKSYALSAVARVRTESEPARRHLYLDAAHLVFVLTAAKKQGVLAAFVAGLQTAPTLLLDDIEPLVANTDREALLRDILAVRRTWHRPTIITSRRHPLFVPGVSPALRSMLLSSATAHLSPLSTRDRRAIVADEARIHAPQTPVGVLAFLAANGGDSEDQLRRITRRVLFSAHATRVRLTLPVVQAILA